VSDELWREIDAIGTVLGWPKTGKRAQRRSWGRVKEIMGLGPGWQRKRTRQGELDEVAQSVECQL
jgi:hypothetical protein